MAQTSTKLRTSIFATAETSDTEVDFLVRVGPEHMKPNGDIAWTDVHETLGGDATIGYSRAWLIVRRAYHEESNPTLLIDVRSLGEAHRKKLAAAKQESTYDFKRQVVAPVVERLRDQEQLSWGEISVRCGLSESTVRNAYKSIAGKKDLGLRIGKGGRFAYQDPTLYTDNMKREGAQIPSDFKGRPAPEQCLNYKRRDGVKVPSKTMIKKVQALLNKALDPACTPEEAETFMAKVTELMAKHGVTKAMLTEPTRARKAS